MAIDIEYRSSDTLTMTPDQFIDHFGTQVAAAAAIGMAQPTVSDWKKQGFIPWLRQLHIERVTDGALTADATDPEVSC